MIHLQKKKAIILNVHRMYAGYIIIKTIEKQKDAVLTQATNTLPYVIYDQSLGHQQISQSH